MMKRTILAGDLGATKINLGIFSTETGSLVPLIETSFHSSAYPNLETIISTFLGQTDFTTSHASFGVAGPVVTGRATITNLNWVIEESRLRSVFHFASVRLLNDLEATAYAVPTLGFGDLYSINKGKPVPDGAIAVIAPGTGLGEAFLTWDGNRYVAHPSEGGHVDFAPVGESQVEMLGYLRKKFAHVSYEHVCSGTGLPNIYDYYHQNGGLAEPGWLAENLAVADDPTPVIVDGALDPAKSCPLCRITLKTFISILGAEAGNLALKVLATGGVYLGGGILPRILSSFATDDFMQAFVRKGRMAELMGNMPVQVITNPRAALLGAAAYGLQSEREGIRSYCKKVLSS